MYHPVYISESFPKHCPSTLCTKCTVHRVKYCTIVHKNTVQLYRNLAISPAFIVIFLAFTHQGFTRWCWIIFSGIVICESCVFLYIAHLVPDLSFHDNFWWYPYCIFILPENTAFLLSRTVLQWQFSVLLYIVIWLSLKGVFRGFCAAMHLLFLFTLSYKEYNCEIADY